MGILLAFGRCYFGWCSVTATWRKSRGAPADDRCAITVPGECLPSLLRCDQDLGARQSEGRRAKGRLV